MATQIDLQRSAKRTPGEFGSGHRIAGLIALVVVAIFGTMQWMHSQPTGAMVDSAQQVSKGDDMPPPAEYFPGKYVNQATQPEKHIESF